VRISFGFLGPFGYWLNGLQSHVAWKTSLVSQWNLVGFCGLILWFSKDWHQSLSLLCLRLISFNMESWLVLFLVQKLLCSQSWNRESSGFQILFA